MSQIEYREIVINPRVINHLGKDLITTSDVAVTELIKNSLDAKASDIRLHIYNDFVQAQKSNAFIFGLPEELYNFLDMCYLFSAALKLWASGGEFNEGAIKL